MSPIPSLIRPGRPPKYRYDRVRNGKPLAITVIGTSPEDVKRQIAAIRGYVSDYGSRHGVMLVVRLVARTDTTARLRVVWDGRRK